MIILFGTRNITYKKDKGSFYCPHCRETLGYHKKRIRQFFSLFFIPLIPLKLIAEFIECNKCKSTFTLEVLKLKPEDFNKEVVDEEINGLILVILTHMMLKERADDKDINDVCKVYYNITGDGIAFNNVKAIHKQTAGADIPASLKELKFAPESTARKKILKSAFIAGQTKKLNTKEVLKIGEALKFAPEELAALLEQWQKENEPITL